MFALIPFVYVVPEYQRVAVFRLGRFIGFRGPGLVVARPFVDRMVYVDLRTITTDVPSQECITRDNVPVTVNAVVNKRIDDPKRALLEVNDHHRATLEVAQTTLRAVIGQFTLDQLLTDRAAVAGQLLEQIDRATDVWGIKVSLVEIKDLEIPADLKRVMAKEAEAERERRAMVIRAAGEREAAMELLAAAKILEQSPLGFRLRRLQAMLDVAEEGNTVVFAPADQAPTALVADLVARRKGDRVSA